MDSNWRSKFYTYRIMKYIKYFNLNAEFYTEEGCYITEISNNPEEPELSIARARVKPGVTTQWHRLRGITERYYIIKGLAIVEIGDLPPQEVTVGDVVLIGPLCRQRITNTGTNDLIFLAICTPRFNQNAYESLTYD
jgi:mannose-6-phosphate isomerase-like protein (cupin superfamily)